MKRRVEEDEEDGTGGDGENGHVEKVSRALAEFPQRLKAQIEIWSGGSRANLRGFANALGKVPGASRPMLLRYIRGEQPPPLTFCIAAAEELGVRLEWLVSGEGPPYDLAAADSNDDYTKRFMAMVHHGLTDGIGEWNYGVDEHAFKAVARTVDEVARALFAEKCRREGREVPERWTWYDIRHEVTGAAHGVGAALFGAIDAFCRWTELDTKEISPDRLSRFIIAVAPALRDLADASLWMDDLWPAELPEGWETGPHHVTYFDAVPVCHCTEFKETGSCPRLRELEASGGHPLPRREVSGLWQRQLVMAKTGGHFLEYDDQLNHICVCDEFRATGSCTETRRHEPIEARLRLFREQMEAEDPAPPDATRPEPPRLLGQRFTEGLNRVHQEEGGQG